MDELNIKHMMDELNIKHMMDELNIKHMMDELNIKHMMDEFDILLKNYLRIKKKNEWALNYQSSAWPTVNARNATRMGISSE